MRLTLFALLTVVAGLAHAHEGSYQVKIDRKTVPALLIAETQGSAGQSLDDFSRQLAPTLRTYTLQTGHEACAVLCKAADGTVGARVFTISSHTACPVLVSCPLGMKPTTQTIHSHAERGEYRINEADRVLLPKVRIGERRRRGNPEAFSEEDMAGGPGYLVSPLGLQYFDGKNARSL